MESSSMGGMGTRHGMGEQGAKARVAAEERPDGNLE